MTDKDEEEDDEKENDTTSTPGTDKTVPIDKKKAHLPYFWGDITSKEADQILKDKDPGSFLVRKNEEIFKLAWKTLRGKILHCHMDLKDNDTVYDEVARRQKLSTSYAAAIRIPCKNPAMELKQTEQDVQRESSRQGEPNSLPYFQGSMTAAEAMIMLQQEQNSASSLR